MFILFVILFLIYLGDTHSIICSPKVFFFFNLIILHKLPPSLQEREEKVRLQAQIKRLWEDNQRLQQESQTSAAKLKKFTEWVFNTIDMN